jgi:hypothetical protein
MNGDDPPTGPDLQPELIERALAVYLQAVESETAPEPAVRLAQYPDLRPDTRALAAGGGDARTSRPPAASCERPL